MNPSYELYTLHRGTLPLLISIPHGGTRLPEEIVTQMRSIARRMDDNDWHLPRLYAFAAEFGASILIPSCSRYVIDLNRPPDDANLYPGQDATGLCPINTFLGEPLYSPGRMPTAEERSARLETYWKPYHQALSDELARLKATHGRVVLWEAHSIRSEVPRFFDGRLPDLNFGTAGGKSASSGMAERLLEIVHADARYSAVLNGRFQGGYITRFYGQPDLKVDAIQLELSQRTYMQESEPYPYLDHLAEQLQPLLRRLLEATQQ